jgi:hypothetical protein
VNDFWAWLSHQFSLWKWSEDESEHQGFIWLVIPLIIILLWRLSFKERVLRAKTVALSTMRSHYLGEDSVFYAVLKLLEIQYYPRPQGENLAHWLAKLPLASALQPTIQQLFALHQRYRFDPKGLNEIQQQQFQNLAAMALRELKRNNLKI